MKNNNTLDFFLFPDSKIAPSFMPAFWYPDWEARGRLLQHLPYIFWLTSVMRPRSVAVLGTGAINAFLAVCQTVDRLGFPAQVLGVLPPHEVVQTDAITCLIMSRYGSFSRLAAGDIDTNNALGLSDDVDLLILCGDTPDHLSTKAASALRSRLSMSTVIVSTGSNETEDTAFWRPVSGKVAAFKFSHAGGLCTTIPEGESSGILADLLVRAAQEPQFEHAARSAFLRLGQGLCGSQHALDAQSTIGHMEIEVARGKAELDEAWENLREHEVVRSSHAIELLSRQAKQQTAETKNELLSRRLHGLEEELHRATQVNQQLTKTTRHEFDVAKGERDQLMAELTAIRASTSWRLTRPLRSFFETYPKAARWARRALKLIWWTVTFQLPSRYRAWRMHAAAHQSSFLQVSDPSASLAQTAADPVAPTIFREFEQRLGQLEHRAAAFESLAKAEQGRLDWSLGAVEGVTAHIDKYHALRRTKEYEAAFSASEPLVSICVATVNRADLLVERALTSLQAQSYQNLQIIVVGDHCTDDTARRIADLRDDRIVFVNLTERGPYPPPGIDRWRVAGSNAMNHALSLCAGDFITHLDDDDRMTADKVAIMLAAAREHRADFLWHSFWYEHRDGRWETLGNGQLELGQVTTGSIFYHRYFAQFGWDVNAYRLGEPGDWNRLRKIKILRPRTHYVAQPLLFHHVEQAQPHFIYQDGERFLD